MRGAWLLACALIFVGCTREIKKDSRVSLRLPAAAEKVGSLAAPSGYELTHIVVNVQAPGLPPFVWTWDKHCGNNCERIPPVDIVLDVPSGPSRLIQYLGVYQSSSAGNMIMYYGDILRDLVVGTNDVTIVATQYGSASGLEGNIIGQYVGAVENVSGVTVGRGPTDMIDVLFRPSSGAQPMLIETTEMFNGWFAVFGLAGIPLEYVRRSNKERLMHNGVPITMDAMITATNSAAANLMRFQSPSVFWVQDGGGSRRESNGGVNVLGFMGPGVSLLTPKACYPNSVSLVSFWNDPVSGSNLTYCGATCSTEDVRRMGSAGTDIASCNIGSNGLISEIEYDPNEMRNGKWGIAPFLGPFKKAPYSHSPGMGYNCYSANKYADGCYDPTGQSVSFQWAYVPHVFTGPGAISGVALMTKVYPGSCDEGEPCVDEFRLQGGDLYDCPNLQSRGFTKVRDFLPADSPNHTLSIPGGLPLGSNMVALFCPYRELNGVRQYFRSAAFVHDLKAPPIPLPNAQLTTSMSGDNSLDSFLVDPNLTSSIISASSDPVAGAVSYEGEVMFSGTTVCSGSNTVPNFDLSSCGGAMFGYGDGNQFNFIMRARDANGGVLRETNQNFKIVVNVPSAAVSVSGCTSTGGGFLFVNLNIGSGVGVSSFDWFLNYGGTNSSPNVSYGSPGIYQLNTGMSDTGTYNNVQLQVKLNHSSGYQVPLATLLFNVSSSTCTPL